MPVHDWTRVDAGIFQSFHHTWITALGRILNDGLLPGDCYALIEPAVSDPEPLPDVVIPPAHESLRHVLSDPPSTRFRMSAAAAAYADRRSRIAVRTVGDHRAVARIDVLCPGSKGSRRGLLAFLDTATEMLRCGIHLLVIDLFPPGPRDPQGIHKAIWDELTESEFTLPPDTPLTLASYKAGQPVEAYIEPTAVGVVLPEMPVFLTPDMYVPLPLETTYQSAWEAVPSFWRDVLQSSK